MLNAASPVKIFIAEFQHVAVGNAVAAHELLRRARAFNEIHDHEERVHAALRVAFLVLLPVFVVLEPDAQRAPLLGHRFYKLANFFLRAVAGAVKKEDVVVGSGFLEAVALVCKVDKKRHPVRAVLRVRVRVENYADLVRAGIHVLLETEVAQLLPNAHARQLGGAVVAGRRTQKLKPGELILVLLHDVLNLVAAEPLVGVTDPGFRGFRGKRRLARDCCGARNLLQPARFVAAHALEALLQRGPNFGRVVRFNARVRMPRVPPVPQFVQRVVVVAREVMLLHRAALQPFKLLHTGTGIFIMVALTALTAALSALALMVAALIALIMVAALIALIMVPALARSVFHSHSAITL